MIGIGGKAENDFLLALDRPEVGEETFSCCGVVTCDICEVDGGPVFVVGGRAIGGGGKTDGTFVSVEMFGSGMEGVAETKSEKSSSVISGAISIVFAGRLKLSVDCAKSEMSEN